MGMGFQFEEHRLGLWDLSWVSKFSELTRSGVFGRANGEEIIKEFSASIYQKRSS